MGWCRHRCSLYLTRAGPRKYDPQRNCCMTRLQTLQRPRLPILHVRLCTNMFLAARSQCTNPKLKRMRRGDIFDEWTMGCAHLSRYIIPLHTSMANFCRVTMSCTEPRSTRSSDLWKEEMLVRDEPSSMWIRTPGWHAQTQAAAAPQSARLQTHARHCRERTETPAWLAAKQYM